MIVVSSKQFCPHLERINHHQGGIRHTYELR